MLIKAGAGSILGYAAGTFAKQVSDILIWWGGISTVFLGWLHYCEYIKINFKKIDADIFHLVAKVAKDDEGGIVRNIKKFITHSLPLMGGFAAAFYSAFYEGHHHH